MSGSGTVFTPQFLIRIHQVNETLEVQGHLNTWVNEPMICSVYDWFWCLIKRRITSSSENNVVEGESIASIGKAVMQYIMGGKDSTGSGFLSKAYIEGSTTRKIKD